MAVHGEIQVSARSVRVAAQTSADCIPGVGIVRGRSTHPRTLPQVAGSLAVEASPGAGGGVAEKCSLQFLPALPSDPHQSVESR